MWLEDPRHHSGGNPRPVVDSRDRHLAFFLTHAYVDAPRTGESGVLEDIQQHVAHLILARHRPARTICASQLPFDRATTHLLETNDVSDDRGDIYGFRRRKVGWRAAVSAERSRDLVKTVDLGQDATDILVEHFVEIATWIRARATQMLHAESNRRQRVLDLVRDLTRHLAPREHAFRARYFDPAQLEVDRQTSGGDTAQPERGKGAGRGGEQHEDSQIASAAIECQIITARRRRENVVLIGWTLSSGKTEQHPRRTQFCFPRRIHLAGSPETKLYCGWQRATDRRQHVEQTVARPREHTISVEEQRRLESPRRAWQLLIFIPGDNCA